MIKIICCHCKAEFLNYKGNHRKFCSRKCKSEYQKKYPNSGCFTNGHTKGFHKGCTPWNTGKKMPKWIKDKYTGTLHWKWKGQAVRYGYTYLLKPNHPNSHKDGYIKRANLVMEKHIGRYLRKGEIVHHINHVRNDDSIHNLRLFHNRSEHQRYHRTKICR